jgi:hypothetical protein
MPPRSFQSSSHEIRMDLERTIRNEFLPRDRPGNIEARAARRGMLRRTGREPPRGLEPLTFCLQDRPSGVSASAAACHPAPISAGQPVFSPLFNVVKCPAVSGTTPAPEPHRRRSDPASAGCHARMKAWVRDGPTARPHRLHLRPAGRTAADARPRAAANSPARIGHPVPDQRRRTVTTVRGQSFDAAPRHRRVRRIPRQVRRRSVATNVRK